MSKFFLDTNILIDILETQRPNHQKAVKLLKTILSDDNKIVLSENSLSDIVYICRHSLAIGTIIQTIHDFTFDNSIIVASFGFQAIRNACSLYSKNGGDFEDYLQYFCAEKEECSVIYTSDKDFPVLKIPVRGYE